MIEQEATVTRVENDRVWVATKVTACKTCQSPCSVSGIAESSVLADKAIDLVTDNSVSVGDSVILEMPEGLLIKASFLVYLLPLLGFLSGALIGERLGILISPALREPLSIVAGLAGLLVAHALVRFCSSGKTDHKTLISISQPR
jgi:sigma-E factor negative regulatory protein RseC